MGLKEISVINNTLSLCKTNSILKNSISESIKGQKLYVKTPFIETNTQGNKLSIVVSNKRSLESACKYKGKRVGVLNFASATRVGGGVLNGSSAQEESICRCSTLYPCLSRLDGIFYTRHKLALKNGNLTSFYNDDCIYTPNVTIFKSDIDNSMLSEDYWYNIDIISCAAPNLSKLTKLSMDALLEEDLLEVYKSRIRRILSVAKKHNIEVLILGAFGCGVFCNSPELVAKAFKSVIDEFIYDFEIIEFAIYCTKSNPKNYDTFKDIFC